MNILDFLLLCIFSLIFLKNHFMQFILMYVSDMLAFSAVFFLTEASLTALIYELSCIKLIG
jgi:hypothetical protein